MRSGSGKSAIRSLTGPARVPISSDGAGEEAAARERPPREMVEERVAHCEDLIEPGRGGERRFDDFGREDPLRFVHGGELKILFRAEVGVDTALAHVERVGEVADREPFEAVDRREGDGLADDRFARALTVRSWLAWLEPC